ncbi:MAG TPA: hypothetical protein VIW73_02920 [Candidatus Cybelea sp.]
MRRRCARACCFLSVAFDLQEILGDNDVQLFDLRSDPDEMHNLALEPEKNKDTILRMNGLLNELLTKEAGTNACRLLEDALGLSLAAPG